MPQGIGYGRKTSRLHDALASKGRNGDSIVAHINPQEADMLQRMGGSGTINPDTGLPEYFVGAAIGGIAALGGAALSASAQSDAADARASANQEAIQVQERRLDSQLADRVDAFGNRRVYDEEEGVWRVVPTQTTENILDALQQERLTGLTEDAARGRRAERRAEDLALPAFEQAQAELDQLGQPDQFTRQGVQGVLTDAATSGIDEAFRGASEQASRSAMRTGGDPRGLTFSRLAERRADALSQARSQAAAQSLGMTQDLNQSEDQGVRANLAPLSEMATMGRTRVSQPNTGARLSQALSNQAQGAGNAFAGLSQANMAAAQNPGVANQGLNFAGGVGALGGLAEALTRNTSSGNTPSMFQNRRRSGNTSSSAGGFGTTSGSFDMSTAPGLTF
jgi:hypothetical protein